LIKIALIAGEGDLPLLVGKSLIQKNYDITFFVVNDNYSKNIYKNYKYIKIKLTSLKAIINNFKLYQINKIIMIGRVQRPSIKDIKFDIETVKFIKNYFLENKGDDKLLTSIQNYFSKKGFQLFDWTKHCHELFSNEVYLTNKKPSKKAILNKQKGLKTFKSFGKSDVGQSIAIQNEIILGLEASEGTDELIKRCYKYKKKGDQGVIIKLSKYKQNKILDIPAIGINTMKFLNKYKFEGIFLELNKCLIINKEKVIKYANQNNLFITSIKKN